MKKLSLIAILFSSLFMNSCSNDFDIASKWKEINIVYALIDVTKPVNYFRIEKAFLDENTSALVMASNVDSIYHDDLLQVSLKHLGANTTVFLEKVNGDTLGLSRPAGVFANTPNILYRTNEPLLSYGTYQLKIKNLSTGTIDSATTNVVDFITPFYPLNDVSLPLSFTYNPNLDNNDIEFKWRRANNAVAYDLIMHFIYREVSVTDFTPILIDTIDLVICKNVLDPAMGLTSSIISHSFNSEEFYLQIQSLLDPKPGVYRIFQKIDFTMSSAGKELYDYYTINNIQTGLVADQILPQYTNISGDYSKGVFSSRTIDSQFKGYGLEARTIDSLICSSYTRNLGFIKSTSILGNTCN